MGVAEDFLKQPWPEGQFMGNNIFFTNTDTLVPVFKGQAH